MEKDSYERFVIHLCIGIGTLAFSGMLYALGQVIAILKGG